MVVATQSGLRHVPKIECLSLLLKELFRLALCNVIKNELVNNKPL